MRTTLRLENDVAARLEQLMKTRRRSFKAVVNEVLRAGLDALDDPARALKKPFRTKGFNLGPSLIGSLDNVEEVLARAERAKHR